MAKNSKLSETPNVAEQGVQQVQPPGDDFLESLINEELTSRL